MVNNFQHLLDSHDVLSMLVNLEQIKSLFNEVGLYDSSSQFADAYVDTLYSFSSKNHNLIAKYFYEEKSLWEIVQAFIKEVISCAPAVSKSEVLKSLEGHDALSNECIYQVAMSIKAQEHVSILGFGLADGGFELELCAMLKKHGKANGVTLYGLDPNLGEHSDIISITPEDIYNNKTPKFDLIISRWVLHHIMPNHRWQSFIGCLQHLTEDGLAIVVEEGVSAKTQNEKSSLFFIATIDVLANFYLWPDYLTSKYDGYFAQYLLEDDLEDISKQAKLSYIKKEVGPIFPHQSVIIFSSLLNDKNKILAVEKP